MQEPKTVLNASRWQRARRRGTNVSLIVGHHTAGRNSLYTLTKGMIPVSSHVLIDKDGTIHKLVDDSRVAYHAGLSSWLGRRWCNEFSLGMEIENLGNGYDPYPDAQVKAAAWQTAQWMNKFGIGWNAVTEHKIISPRRKIDISANFPRDQYKTYVFDYLRGGAKKPAAKKSPPKPKVLITKTLRYGDKGTDVVTLQKRLGIHADGDYGKITKRAVYNFQKRTFRSSRDCDGIAGPKTLNALGLYKKPSDTNPTLTRTLKFGSRGKDVLAVQKALKGKGWKIGTDGIYGPGTKLIVTKFQKIVFPGWRNRVNWDGIVGPATAAKMGFKFKRK